MWLGYPLMKNDAPEHQFQKKPVGQHARQEALIGYKNARNLSLLTSSPTKDGLELRNRVGQHARKEALI
jgi:hypothetical protein